jgi:hypothetical protein
MKRRGFLLVPIVMAVFAVLADTPEDVRARLERAEEDVALAVATEERIAQRLADLETDPDAAEEALAAMRAYLEEVSLMRAGFEATLKELEALAEEMSDPQVADGMRAFSDALAVLPEADGEEEDDLARMIAEFDASLSEFDGVIYDHLSSIRNRMDRRLDAGSLQAGPRARAAAEAAELLRSMGVDPGVPGEENAQERPAASAPRGEAALGEQPRGRRNEDIVARQLREAAERETDPELRERLWAEYEAYLDGRS